MAGIFISHKSEECKVADMLKDYLVSVGVPGEKIFVSSLPGNDVKHVISKEVKEKLQTSVVNIAILSAQYYTSAYCLNEAGVIWLREDVPAIVIGMPEITHENMLGFLNNDYKLRRLNNSGDISHIYDTVRNVIKCAPVSMVAATEASSKLIDRYNAYLVTQNASATSKTVSINVNLDEFMTDEEKIVLYYVLSKRVCSFTKTEIEAWLKEMEILDVNLNNAFALIAGLEKSSYDSATEKITLDIEFFRKMIAKQMEFTKLLQPVLKKHQQLSSDRFTEMWNNGIFKDTDKLLLAYILKNRVVDLGTGWMEKIQIEAIQRWEREVDILGDLSCSYGAAVSLLFENDLVYISEWTKYNQPRKYSLCPSLRKLFFVGKCPYECDLDAVVEKFKNDLPF